MLFHLVVLGLQTAPKDYLGLSEAEMVHGQTLRVPGDFLSCPCETLSSSLRGHGNRGIGGFIPVHTSQHGLPASPFLAGLRGAKFVLFNMMLIMALFDLLMMDLFQLLREGTRLF
ncbi:hypothetical protein LDENG_00011090 [Lucifuga dentata]|nr:hypothetical protein LDENG_00011090 [Lucifuga dentata]